MRALGTSLRFEKERGYSEGFGGGMALFGSIYIFLETPEGQLLFRAVQ